MTDNRIEVAAKAVMEARTNFGWSIGKRRKVMAIDLIMAEAALKAADEMLPSEA